MGNNWSFLSWSEERGWVGVDWVHVLEEVGVGVDTVVVAALVGSVKRVCGSADVVLVGEVEVVGQAVFGHSWGSEVRVDSA